MWYFDVVNRVLSRFDFSFCKYVELDKIFNKVGEFRIDIYFCIEYSFYYQID